MTRIAGAKNKPKTIAQLLDMLKAAADKEGIELTPNMVEKAAKNAAEKAGGLDKLPKEILDNADKALSRFHSLEIEIPDDDDIDTYKCGKCGEVMASAMPKCPKCNATLKW